MGSSKVRQTLDSTPPASPPTSGGNPYLVGTDTSNDGCHPLYPDTAINERQARVGWTCGGLMYGYGGTFAAQPNATNLTTEGSYYVDCGQQGVIVFNVTTMCAYTLWKNPWYNHAPAGTVCPTCHHIYNRWAQSTEIRAFIGNPTSEPTTDAAGNWWQQFDYGILAHGANNVVYAIGGRARITGMAGTSEQIPATARNALVSAWKSATGYKRPAGHTQYVKLAPNDGWVLYTDGRTHGYDSDGTFVVQRDAPEAFYVQGLIQDHWGGNKWIFSGYGWPTSSNTPVSGGEFVSFDRGDIYRSPGNFTYGVSGQILTQYQALHGPAGSADAVLGFPTEDAPWVSYEDPPAHAYPLTQTFQNGSITAMSATSSTYTATNPPLCSWFCLHSSARCETACTYNGAPSTCGDDNGNGQPTCNQYCYSSCTQNAEPSQWCVDTSTTPGFTLSSCGAQGVCWDCQNICPAGATYCAVGSRYSTYSFDPTTRVTTRSNGPFGSFCDTTECPASPPNYNAIGNFGPFATSTNSARNSNAWVYQLGVVPAGTSVRVGTCGMAEAHYTGNTFLRLNISGTTTTVAFNNDSCGEVNKGSQINYVVPYDMHLEIRGGCRGAATNCSGDVAKELRFDAAPRPAHVKQAFNRMRDEGVIGGLYDWDTKVRGIYYQGNDEAWGFGEFHFQGIQRTYNRAVHDMVWTTSVKHWGAPEYNNLFFGKLASRPLTSFGLSQRFGRNTTGPGTLVATGYGDYVTNESTTDPVHVGVHAGTYDQWPSYDARDWDGLPTGHRFNHGGGIQTIGNYVIVGNEDSESNRPGEYQPDGTWQQLPNRASQVFLYRVDQAIPQGTLLIASRDRGAAWTAIAKLPDRDTVPPALRNGYVIMREGQATKFGPEPTNQQYDVYAIPADPCTGYASLYQVKPYMQNKAGTLSSAPQLPLPMHPDVPRCAGPSILQDVRQVSHVGCWKRINDEHDNPNFRATYHTPDCPFVRTVSPTGGVKQFSNDDDVQSVTLVTQADGKLFLLAFEGQRFEIGPNSEVQLYRVVWGAASGIAPAQRAMPGTGGDCQELLCLVREDYLNMHVNGGINGSMFRFGGGAYIPPGTSDPTSQTFFIYGSEHYIQRNPRLVLWNEF